MGTHPRLKKSTLCNSAITKNLIELSKERMKMSLCLMYKHLADNKRLRPKEIACHDSLKKIQIPKSHHLALDQWITDWANNRSSCWKRRENLHKNEMTAVISKLKHEI